MATAVQSEPINLESLTGEFDLSSVLCFNISNLGRVVLNTFKIHLIFAVKSV